MINKITRGRNIGGVIRYLAGRGRSNEHCDQRVIAADVRLQVDDGMRLDGPEHRAQVQRIARVMDAHRTLLGAPPAVWHCSISLPKQERLSDAQWAHVARVAVAEMGFTTASGRAPCRWVAIGHGPSANGNDHIHLAVNLVREDGTRASIWRDQVTMSRVCARLERELGLYVVPGRPGRGLPGYTRAEAERARRTGHPEPDRHTLARLVRGAAAAAVNGETEFLTHLRAAGVLARPHHTSGGRVSGYAVALPVDGQPPVWFGGGRLAPDLTLPRLRTH